MVNRIASMHNTRALAAGAVQGARFPNTGRAFTIIECLAILAVLAVLFTTLLPGLARTRPPSHAVRCQNNLRQLTVAWGMYAADSNDALPLNAFSGAAMGGVNTSNWITGWLDWTTTSDNTNIAVVADPRYAKLASYFARDARLFKCPADNYLSAIQKSIGFKQRVRSISMCIAIGQGEGKQAYIPALRIVTRMSDISSPPPARTWVLADEQADSINDPCLVVNPTLYPANYQWIDLPAAYHNGAGSFSFADGHTELKKWRDPRTLIRPMNGDYLPIISPGNVDYQWVIERMPR